MLRIACCFHLQGTGLNIETAAVSVIFMPLHQTTRRHFPEDRDLRICRCENLKYHVRSVLFSLSYEIFEQPG